MRKNGIFLASSFSFGCEKAKLLGIDERLEEYVKSRGKSESEKEIRKLLGQLLPYFWYLTIAKANSIKDPFSFEVVRAYWIGGKLLKNVKPQHILQTLKEFKEKGKDIFSFALAAKKVLKNKKYPCHNSHVLPECKVELKEGYFWHWKKARMRASQKDIQDFLKYGKG